MTTPDRGLPPLSRRRTPTGGAASLIGANRTSDTPPPPSSEPARAADDVQPVQPPAEVPAPPARTPASAKATRAARARKAAGERAPQTNVTLSEEVRLESLSAAKVAGAFEGVRNYSAFVEGAIVREIQRLRDAHNGGRPFPPAPAG